MNNIAKKKPSKGNYRSVQFPETIVKEVQFLIGKYPIYRSHHEFLINAGINKITDFIDIIHKRDQLMIKEDLNKKRQID